MRYAIVSDVHANRQAWAAVRRDIRTQGADAILCLGDIVGYGPMPSEVVASVLEDCQITILGNHDAVVGGRCDPEIFNDKARRVIEWTQARLGSDAEAIFVDLPNQLEGDTFLAVHGDLVEPESFVYIETPEQASDNFRKMQDAALLFVGHTHHAGIFMQHCESGRIHWAKLGLIKLTNEFRYIVNVGSVGDPRDANDIRASYCIYDEAERSVTNRRVPFDIQAYQSDLRHSGLEIKPFFISQSAMYQAGPGTGSPGMIRPKLTLSRLQSIIIDELPHLPVDEEDDGSMRSVRTAGLRVRSEAKAKIRLEGAQVKRPIINYAAIMREKRAALELQRSEAEADARRAQNEAICRKREITERAAQREIEKAKRDAEWAAARRRQQEEERMRVKAALAIRQALAQRREVEEPEEKSANEGVGDDVLDVSAPDERIDRKRALLKKVEERKREREAEKDATRERIRRAIEAKRQCTKNVE